MADEVEVSLCCDVLLEAIESGGIQVVEVETGTYCEVVPDQDGKTGIAINFCPFCGEARPNRGGLQAPAASDGPS
jgi:pyridoxine 5'-phosphate synthase PdxJ